MTKKQLRNLLRALVVGTTVPSVAGAFVVACGSSSSPNGAQSGTDATVSDDGSSGFTGFGGEGGSLIDSHVDWCAAGPPVHFGDAGPCYNYVYVPCGLPPGTYIDDDSGGVSRCDQICVNVANYDCQLLDNNQVSNLLYGEAGPPDAGAGADDAGDGGASEGGGAVPQGPGVYVKCDCVGGGRRPRGLSAPRTSAQPSVLAAFFSAMAHLEAAAVPAFGRMEIELRALSAPRSLLTQVARAIRDEERHARTMRRVARRFGGSVEPVRVRRFRPRGVAAISLENAVEGCVRETYGALLAWHQAEHAEDPEIRRAMRAIAEDETRHAALSLRTARFLEAKLDARQRARVTHARREAIHALHVTARAEPPMDLVRVAGLPRAAVARRMLEGLERDLWAA